MKGFVQAPNWLASDMIAEMLLFAHCFRCPWRAQLMDALHNSFG